MKDIWTSVQLVLAGIGAGVGWLLGGCDGLMTALICCAVFDYITGVMCAVAAHKLSSAVGAKGICKKVCMFLLVGVANIMDRDVIGTGSALRTAVVFFYISNEGVSLLENAANLGLPVPDKLKIVLQQLHEKDGGKS